MKISDPDDKANHSGDHKGNHSNNHSGDHRDNHSSDHSDIGHVCSVKSSTDTAKE